MKLYKKLIFKLEFINTTFAKHFLIIVLFLCSSSLYSQVSVLGKVYTVDECVENATNLEQKNDYRGAASFLNEAAFFVWEKKDYDNAIELFSKSILLNEKINNVGGIAGIESNLGMIYNDKKDYKNSLASFQNALKIRQKQKEKLPIIKTHINISVVMNNLSMYDESIKQLEMALKLAGEINDIEEMKSCYAGLSETYEKKGDRQSSLSYFDKLKTINEGVHREQEARIKASLAKIEQNLSLTEAEKKSKEVQLALKEKELHDKKSQLHTTDSANKELSQRIEDINSKLISLEKEEAINELQRQTIKNQLKQEQQIRLFIIVIAFVLLAFLIILFNTVRRIKRLNKLLTERNEEVLKQKQAIEDENKVRTKLLSIISHDLRTPLSAVYLFLQILRTKTLSPEMVDKHLAKLETSLNSSFQMLDNMLYWAKSQINGITNKPEIVDVFEAVDSNLDFLNTNIQNKSIIIENRINEIVYIYADKEMVNIILRNLISNAIKFTPKGGKITLTFEKNPQYITLNVCDTGVGMSKQQQECLFTPQVVSQTGTAKESGTGLGLTLVRDFVQLCKGKLSFESSENLGTTFNVSLPLANEEQLKQQIK